MSVAATKRLAKSHPYLPPPASSKRNAWVEWWDGTKRVDIWWTLAWFDIVLRYRRSMLGPFWLTLSMGALIAGMGPLYSSLFNINLTTFFPYLALGIIYWSLFSNIVTDSCSVFINSSSHLKQAYFPISLFVWRSIARNLIVFAHQIILFLPIAYWVNVPLTSNAWLVVPALLLALINAHAIGLMLGLLCTRYRDVAQIISSVMQVLMFLTPVFWMDTSLPERAKYVLWNPLAQLLNLLRAPLLGGAPGLEVWLVIAGWTTFNIIAAGWLFRKYRRRVIYWL
ncbi:ABC transporter permease [Oryzisolibacter sp. LB2S]|uniref:ABC transporter permease n=1 Tax=Alicycliphilus soli TaxID=3228789 RepID=UPI00345A13D4